MLNRICGAGLLFSLLAVVVGCASPKGPGANSLAAIVVTNQTPVEIAKAISSTFEQAGFTAMTETTPQASRAEYRLAYERPAGTRDTVLYGDWSFKQNFYRARIRILKQEGRRYLITCDAFRVLNHGEAHFEEEKRLSRAKAGQYQKLLEQAATKLPITPIEDAPQL
jgi:hypothetical protein